MSTIHGTTPPPIQIGISGLAPTGHEERTEGTSDQDRVSVTRQRGVTARERLDVGHVGERPLAQVRDAEVQQAPLVAKSSTLKTVLKTLAKVALVGGLIAAGIATGGVGLIVAGGVIGGAMLVGKGIQKLISNPMRESVFGKTQKRTENLQGDQSRIARLPNTRVETIQTRSGETMRGNFFAPGSNGTKGMPDLTKPVVLLLTGSAGTCQAQGQDLARMYSNGNPDANVLSVNYRGYGDSDGGLPSKESVYKDGHAMFNHLLEMGFKPEQIVVHGYSMGGAVAAKLQQSVENQGMQLKGVVYDRPMTSVYEAAKAHMEPEKGRVVGSLAGLVGRFGAGPMDTRGKVASLSTKGQTPVLVTYDREVLGPNAKSMGDKLHARMGERATVVATGADHESNAMTVRNIGDRYRQMLG